MAELGAIYDFVNGALRYTRDPSGYDVFTPAEKALDMGVGDCDEQTQLAGILATNLGYPVIVRAVSFRNGKFSHVYPLMGVRKGKLISWVPVDVTHRRGVGQSVNHQQKMEVRV
jgi:transglutaminase-like putative cysteine protease